MKLSTIACLLAVGLTVGCSKDEKKDKTEPAPVTKSPAKTETAPADKTAATAPDRPSADKSKLLVLKFHHDS